MGHCLDELAKKYPQLLMPIEKGIKDSEEYKNVCLRGQECNRPLLFNKNQNDYIETVNTIAGNVEILLLNDRDDFVHACRALGNKCEPVEIPDSTGAMAIFGLNNWQKVKANQENYKDSLIILSAGNYSNVTNNDVSKVTNNKIVLTSTEWILKSIEIRKYHELTHFVMRKLYPENIDFIRDELIADCIGLIAAFGYFDTRLLKLFLGIENSEYREGGRLENYEGGKIENIPKILKMIDELKDKVKKLNTADINTIWSNIIELM